MANGVEFKSIAVSDLLLDLNNPRYPPQSSQRDAIAKVIEGQGMKLVRLGEDIVENGLNPSRRLIVNPSPDGYIAREGNRRVATLKLLVQKELRDSLSLPARVAKGLQTVATQAEAEGTLPKRVDCAVMSPEDATHWVLLEHTGENEGIGVVPWDSVAKRRFLGTSPALQALEMVDPYLDAKTRPLMPEISITNIERILNTPEARDAIGVKVSNGKLTLSQPEDLARARLLSIVSDIAHRTVRVPRLRTQAQRVSYAQEVAVRKLPPLKTTGGAGDAAGTGASPKPRRVPVERTTLIPKSLKLRIDQARINRIYDELQRLRLTKFLNCGAVMLRVFVEQSIDDYARRHSISLKVTPKLKPGSAKAPIPREMKLQEKLKVAADSLQARGVCPRQELHGVRTLATNRNHPLSVDSLHAYVHNKDYSPSAHDLTTTWDNIQPFVVALWKR